MISRYRLIKELDIDVVAVLYLFLFCYVWMIPRLKRLVITFTFFVCFIFIFIFYLFQFMVQSIAKNNPGDSLFIRVMENWIRKGYWVDFGGMGGFVPVDGYGAVI